MSLKTTQIFEAIKNIPDPEIPVINIEELGVLRAVNEVNNYFEIVITPTYTGCPAMKHIEQDIEKEMVMLGITNYKIKTILSPAWTTDWITEEAKLKLFKYGISPPNKSTSEKAVLLGKEARVVQCPNCKSLDTEMINQFGSTACKALYKCKNCLEPFDYFKCL
jgi:ring-1,2-phenylacetyl-CoA epoxidase subunit PaaD